VKNTGKNRSEAESYSASEAAASLGVSIPTLKRMAAEGRLESFRTPGGHLRILGESVAAVKERRPTQTRPVRDASPVLQNRRERLEELTLDAQEVRARRELAKLHREEQEEAEGRQAEAQAREEEAAQRQAELELEQERLEHEQSQERMRLERERSQERQRSEAEQALAAFRCRWSESATEVLSAKELTWLSAVQRKEILDAIETEIAKRQPQDEPRMVWIVTHAIAALVEPYIEQQQARERRKRIIEDTLRKLSCYATDAERARASGVVRESVSRFPWDAEESEIRSAAEEAMRPVTLGIEKRQRDERLLKWVVWELPWGSDERDRARLCRECGEILAELSQDVSELEAKEALEPTIREACREIEDRQKHKQRDEQKANLIQQGIAEIPHYLWRLKQDGEITSEEYLDSDFRAALTEAVKSELERELSGDEATQEVKERVHEIVDDELLE
jgi:excisionase family DNA binding protein